MNTTYDQHRRSIRRELHAARCRDKDQSPERYDADAKELNRRMTAWNARQTLTIDAGATIAPSDDSECQPEPWELLC